MAAGYDLQPGAGATTVVTTTGAEGGGGVVGWSTGIS